MRKGSVTGRSQRAGTERQEKLSHARPGDEKQVFCCLRVIAGRVALDGTAIRSIFSICNALCQGGLLTLPDVPPSVCHPSGRHRQRRGPKPGGQRNLDPWIGRGRASQHGDCQHRGGRGPAVRGKVNPSEVLIKAVKCNKPKMLSGLNQKVRGQVQRLAIPLPRIEDHRPTGTT